jgi:hypothetical protein
MDTPRVPEDDVSWLGLDLDPLAAAVVEPRELLLGELVRVAPSPSSLGCLVLVLLKELGIERERAGEDHEAAVVGPVDLLQTFNTISLIRELKLHSPGS